MTERDTATESGSASFDQTLPGANPSSPSGPELAIERGAMIGRYVVLKKIGAGAMGVVLAAYDPELDRKVALKLLKPRGNDRKSARARLQREAQALAKLHHPNVVGVHDVGVHAEQLFLAMEFVAGRTLGAWMEAGGGQPQPWREVIRAFTAAGRGLAAAHEAGLVHRDFKPDNVMFGDDGRVRVMDFGLARNQADEAGGVAVSYAALAKTNVALESLTRSGALLGTPAYMAPEQFAGHPADAHSDQFSFCVALHEALYGPRPFAATTLAALYDAIERGEVRPAPRGSNVPSWLRKLVVRGLARDPARRWPSMQALLDALADDPTMRRRRRWVVVVVAGLLGSATWSVITATQRDAQTCAGLDERLDGVWDDSRRAEVESAFLATKSSHAQMTWQLVEAQLDDYASAWMAARLDTCEANRRNEQSDVALDLRMACLDDRLGHLRATVDELTRADAKLIDRAVQAVSAMPSLDRCADVVALQAEIPPPEDRRVAARVRVLDEQLVVALAKQDAGRFPDGLTLTDAVVDEAATLGYEPLQARAWLRQGALQMRMGDYEGAEAALTRAYDAALAQGMRDEAARAAIDLVYLTGYVLARPEQGRSWAIHADPLSRASRSDEIRAAYFDGLGAVANWEGELEQARDLYERALAIKERTLGPEDLRIASSLNNLGVVAEAMEDYDAAQQLQTRALAIKQERLGPDHPSLAISLDNLGGVEDQIGDHAGARVHFERALAIRETMLGFDHVDLATSLGNLGNNARLRGEYEQARVYYERALAIRDAALEPDHPLIAYTTTALGRVLIDLGQAGEALPQLERALAIRSQAEVDPNLLALTRATLAAALWDAPADRGRDRPRARELAELARLGFTDGDQATKRREEVEVWLAAHPLEPGPDAPHSDR